jgi:hypothetical protein
MKTLQIASLLAFFALTLGLFAEDIELANGTVLKDAKILSATANALNVFRNGQMKTISAGDLSQKSREAFLKEGKEAEAPRELGTWVLNSNDFLYLNRDDSNPIARMNEGCRSTVIAEAGSWKKVQIEVWVNSDETKAQPRKPVVLATPPQHPIPDKTPEPEVLKPKLKEFDVENVRVTVTAANLRLVNVLWSARYHFQRNASRIVHLQAQFLDRYMVPLITTEEQKLYLSGGETISGSFSISRERFETCKYVIFFFGEGREPTNPIQFDAY